MPKTINFFENSADNLHCLQACVKSVLSFYFPNQNFTDQEIDEETLQVGSWTWFPPAAVWLHDLGLKVELYSPMDFKRFVDEGEVYMKDIKGEGRFNFEKDRGVYDLLPEIQDASKQMIGAGLWRQEFLSREALAKELLDENTFAIGKTGHELLSGFMVPEPTSHYVVVIKEYSPGTWKIHDPGLPGIKNRKVPQTLPGGLEVLQEILLIKKGPRGN